MKTFFEFMHTMKQQTVTGVLFSLFLTCHIISGSLATCFAQDTGTDPVILHFVTMKADKPKVWDEAIAWFEQAHPNIKIEREIAPHSSTAYHDLLAQKLKNQDRSMDLFFMDVIWPSEFAAAGWALALDEYFLSLERGKFLKSTMDAGTYQGHIYGVPSRIDSGMLYYRKDLLEKYGFSPPVTWEEKGDVTL